MPSVRTQTRGEPLPLPGDGGSLSDLSGSQWPSIPSAMWTNPASGSPKAVQAGSPTSMIGGSISLGGVRTTGTSMSFPQGLTPERTLGYPGVGPRQAYSQVHQQSQQFPRSNSSISIPVSYIEEPAMSVQSDRIVHVDRPMVVERPVVIDRPVVPHMGCYVVRRPPPPKPRQDFPYHDPIFGCEFRDTRGDVLDEEMLALRMRVRTPLSRLARGYGEYEQY